MWIRECFYNVPLWTVTCELRAHLKTVRSGWELDNQKQTPTLQANWPIGQLAIGPSFPEQTYLGKKPDNISVDGGKLEGLDNIRMTRVRLGP